MTASLNAVVCVVALIVYTVSHSVFFWFYTSRDAERTLRRRTVSLLCLVRSLLAAEGRIDAVRWLDDRVMRCADDARGNTVSERETPEEREARNLRRMGIWVGPLMVLLLVALVALAVYNAKRGCTLTLAHWFGLLLALFTYVPEIVLFQLATDRYALASDCEVIRAFLPENVAQYHQQHL